MEKKEIYNKINDFKELRAKEAYLSLLEPRISMKKNQTQEAFYEVLKEVRKGVGDEIIREFNAMSHNISRLEEAATFYEKGGFQIEAEKIWKRAGDYHAKTEGPSNVLMDKFGRAAECYKKAGLKDEAEEMRKQSRFYADKVPPRVLEEVAERYSIKDPLKAMAIYRKKNKALQDPKWNFF